MKTKRLAESFQDAYAAVSIDRATRVARNVALAGSDSKNGYRYTEAALKEAAPLYEDRPVFLDHMKNPRRPFDRSARDLAGHVRNVRYENGRLRGDVHTLDTDAGRTYLGLAEAKGRGVGMSHVVMAEGNDEGTEFHAIKDVLSVDAVAYPATVDSFAESRQPRRRSIVRQLRKQLADLAERLSAVEAKKPRSEGRGDLAGASAESQLIAALAPGRKTR